MKTKIAAIGLVAGMILVALPTGSVSPTEREFQFVVDLTELDSTYFVLGMDEAGDFVADLTSEPKGPGSTDACATAAPSILACSGVVAGVDGHSGHAPLFYALSGAATAIGASGSASVSLAYTTLTTTTFTCNWAANGGIVGALIISGACGFSGFGFGTTGTLGGSQSATNTGALAHLILG